MKFLTHRLLPLLILLAVLPGMGAAQSSKAELKNDVTIEILGRCLLYSFSYQRTLSEHFGLELGASLLGGSGGSVAFLTAGARAYALASNASPCIGGGIVFVTSATSAGPGGGVSTSYGYVGPGFEYRSSSGFLFRGTVYFLIREDGFFVWPGLQVGIAF